MKKHFHSIPIPIKIGFSHHVKIHNFSSIPFIFFSFKNARFLVPTQCCSFT